MYTEQQVLDVLRTQQSLPLDTIENRHIALKKFLLSNPDYQVALPDSLLDKLGIEHDQVDDIGINGYMGCRFIRRQKKLTP